MIRPLLAIVLAVAFGSAASAREPAPPPTTFFVQLRQLCGQGFAGKVVSSDPADAALADKPLVIRVGPCEDRVVRIAFAVGEDRSRTWLVTRTGQGLRLKHDHRHADGVEDVVSRYGGETASALGGSPNRQEFPADAYSKALFLEKGNPASVDNVWAMEVQPGRLFAYELRRPNRFFRVEFDLSRPLRD